MAFTLRITFSGLCLFVPEPVGAGGRMHVLMPGMFEHPNHGAERHVSVLAYDTGHLVAGSPLTGISALAKLAGHTFSPAGSGAAADLKLCSQIVNLREVTNQPVDPDHLGADVKKKLVSRVTLGAGKITRVSPGVCWEWGPGEFRPIAHQVEWEVPNVQGDRITLVSEPIDGGGTSRALGTLFPVDGRVNLKVFHEMQQDLPPDPLPIADQPKPKPGDSPPHFAAYYDLFGGPVPTRMPKYRGELDDCPALPDPCAVLPPDLGGTPFTCLVAGVGG
jgi:hypothetical protein